MKDQNTIDEKDESQQDKMKRAQGLFLESVLKPDNVLRGCAHNQKCYNELMAIREHVVEYVKGMEF